VAFLIKAILTDYQKPAATIIPDKSYAANNHRASVNGRRFRQMARSSLTSTKKTGGKASGLTNGRAEPDAHCRRYGDETQRFVFFSERGRKFITSRRKRKTASARFFVLERQEARAKK
jgi:hypothetical protein